MAKVKGKQKFGGSWTEEKLEMIKKYLTAYATILNQQNFRFGYVDAFAGTGYRELKKQSAENLLIDSLLDKEPQEFMDGSAKIALKTQPEFDRYIFIEKDARRFANLEKLKTEFPDKKDRIILVKEDANVFLKKFCQKNWKSNRAVVFLDPFGMQVTWETLTYIAQTEAIDLWILFPLGSGVSRFLRRDGQIPTIWKEKLNALFGEDKWYDAFYQPALQGSLFDDTAIEKVADFKTIAAYFVSRLKTIFPYVHEQPLELLNSKNVPLFLLCFAASNKKGGKVALKIANDILRSNQRGK